MPTTEPLPDHVPPWWLYVAIFVPLLPVAIWAATYRPIGYLAVAACVVPLCFSVALLVRKMSRRGNARDGSGITP